MPPTVCKVCHSARRTHAPYGVQGVQSGATANWEPPTGDRQPASGGAPFDVIYNRGDRPGSAES